MKKIAIIFASLVLVAGTFAVSQATAEPALPSLTFQKVDEAGKLLPGGTFAGQTCTRPDEDSPLNCEPLEVRDWFAGALTATGSSGNMYEVIDIIGPWTKPIAQCLAVRELTPPEGYVASTTGAMVCKGPGGWTAENAAGLSIEVAGVTVQPGLGDWTVTNTQTQDNPQMGNTVLTLVNKRVQPSVEPSESETSSATASPPPSSVAPAPSTSAPSMTPPAPARPQLPKTGVAEDDAH